MVTARLKYLIRDVSRHGQVRLYVRRPGLRKIRLWIDVDDPDFLVAYQAALSGRQLSKLANGDQGVVAVSRARPETFRALCESYLASPRFKGANHPTRQRTVRGILERCCQEPIKPGSDLVMGDCPLKTFGPRHVIILRDRKSTTPMAANNRVKEIRRVFNWAQEEDPEREIPNPATKIQRLNHKKKGFHSWTLAEVAQYEARHPIGTRPRLAFDLLLYTAARRGDVARLGRQHVTEEGWIVFRIGKTDALLEIPIAGPLAESISATPIGQMQFLITEHGKPYSPSGFGNAMRKWCDQAGLPHCSAHGLRKATAARLAELGCSEEEIAAVTGHLDPSQIRIYTRAARRRLMAASAMEKFVAGLKSEQKCPT